MAQVGVLQAPLELALFAAVHSWSMSMATRSSKLSSANWVDASWRWNASAKAVRCIAVIFSTVAWTSMMSPFSDERKVDPPRRQAMPAAAAGGRGAACEGRG